jgi:hypothetical protein
MTISSNGGASPADPEQGKPMCGQSGKSAPIAQKKGGKSKRKSGPRIVEMEAKIWQTQIQNFW